MHALFKALLFLCAGMMIHSLGDCQDIRFMGGLVSFMPLTSLLFNICNLSLCGLPFMSGFYSKDLMAEAMSMEHLNLFVYMIFYISIGLTTFYSFRLTYYSLPIDEFIIIKFSKILVIIMGSTLMWILFPTPYFICLPILMKLLTLFMIMLGVSLGYESSKFSLSYTLYSYKFLNSSSFLANMWNLPILSTFGINSPFLWAGKSYLKRVDQGWLEHYGGQNLFMSLKQLSCLLQSLSASYFKIYLLFLLVWMGFLTILIFI